MIIADFNMNVWIVKGKLVQNDVKIVHLDVKIWQNQNTLLLLAAGGLIVHFKPTVSVW